MKGGIFLPKPLKKDTHIKVYCSNKEKKIIEKMTLLSNKDSMSEFILDTILDTDKAVKEINMKDMISLFERQYSEGLTFQKEQQITTYILVQFAMYLASENKSRDEIMLFYENAYSGAIEKFGKED